MKKNIVVLAFILIFLSSCSTMDFDRPISNPEPDGDVVLIEGFESGGFWNSCNFDLPVWFESTDEWALEGDFSGRFEFFGLKSIPDLDREISFECDGPFGLSFEGADKICAHINNLSFDSVKLSFSIKTFGERFRDSMSVEIMPGENINVVFDLESSSFQEEKEIEKIILKIHSQIDGEILVDDIRLVKSSDLSSAC